VFGITHGSIIVLSFHPSISVNNGFVQGNGVGGGSGTHASYAA